MTSSEQTELRRGLEHNGARLTDEQVLFIHRSLEIDRRSGAVTQGMVATLVEPPEL
jgi:hypothetical protein